MLYSYGKVFEIYQIVIMQLYNTEVMIDSLRICYKKCLVALQCSSAELYKNISQTLLMKLCHNFYFLPYFAKMRSKFVLDLIDISFQYYI